MTKTLVLQPVHCETLTKRSLVPGEQVTVGRAERADVAVPFDEYMSRVHFVLECTSARDVLRDLGSANGTLLNGRKVRYAHVGDGDEITAGMTVFVVQLLDGPSPADDETSTGSRVTAPPATKPYEEMQSPNSPPA